MNVPPLLLPPLPLPDDERLPLFDPLDDEPAVPTLPVALPPCCRQPVTIIEPSLLPELCA